MSADARDLLGGLLQLLSVPVGMAVLLACAIAAAAAMDRMGT
jgi:hypothetical protein